MHNCQRKRQVVKRMRTQMRKVHAERDARARQRKRRAGMIRWLCQLYQTRGLQLVPAVWNAFADFCEQQGLDRSPPPGTRTDGRDPWDVFQQYLESDDA